MPQLFLPLWDFIRVRDGNELAASIANRHYSRIWKGNINQNRLCGNGERVILVHPLGNWVFVWNKQKYRKDGQEGVNCVLFRNESSILSSQIILMCEKYWNDHFGMDRKFTYVHPRLVKSSNPGYCFQKAGWVKSGLSKKGLILLVKDA
ncbi:hypothetical protein CAL7716_100120 (plasmid) [Calothrix sp. PCC 7716]|nr:hypothetical protein CAL7716_100120 [Calothrix sp. PCC 7716]